MPKPKSVAVIGFGRFGQLWASILKDDFTLCVYDEKHDTEIAAASLGFSYKPLQEALKSDVIFYCVPISRFEDTLISHLPHFANQSGAKTLIDVLSVKSHPMEVFAKHLPPGYSAILTHPMFGPDSFTDKSGSKKTLVIDCKDKGDKYQFWLEYFRAKDFMVLPMSADEHDRLAAQSQGVTHFIGRILAEFDLKPTSIDTAGATKLQEIKEQVGNDSWQLFVDLQTYNPYTRAMRVDLAKAQSKVFNRLLPNRINKQKLIVGIQGGRGSFNEEAATYYLSRTPEIDYELVYLHTTEQVLRALHEGMVDRGQFAMHNSLGGIVTESVQAMANYNFEIVEEFAIKISHALMIAQDSEFSQIDTIMTHPQVLRQCRSNLQNKYGRLKQTSGEGDLVDHAEVALLMGQGKLAKNIATMGSKVLASINNLKIIEADLQDLDSNFTSFLWVQRPA
ncbi:MAG: prephenate dehydrogenase/arogenate dehydrogenase family protein [Candidatus Obscuribacter sp.]|nr:prephenate dehydrogenase/arogenate dehydrogenase family protein [Candidatus Obscuribacter sp.]